MRRAILAAAVLVVSVCASGRSQAPDSSTGVGKPTLNVVGTSHLDTQWRWSIRQTINEFIPATFRDNFRLMDEFPHYTFSFEGAFRYMLLREYYPELYARLGPYVAASRWRPTGSWVDAVDVNVPSFESLVRHALYGNGYFKKEFGIASRDVFLPDCFGFGYALPSVAAHCGIKSFSTQKLSWGSSVGVPFGIGVWEGVDGSSLYAALKPGDYVTKIRADLSKDTAWARKIEEQRQISGLNAGYMYFGTGDTGGSPDSASVAWLEQSQKSDGPLTVRSIGADDLVNIAEADKNAHLPRYKGELLMTRHGVGCYTSQAAMKRWNRKNETLANATERAAVIADLFAGSPYPRDALRETWIRFLWHQFHDDITGTSIPEAYEFSWNDELLCQNRFAGMLEHAVESFTPALDTRVKGVPLVVFNPLSIPREDIIEATVLFPGGAPQMVRVYDQDGKEVPAQVVRAAQDSVRIIFLAHVPSVGYAVYDVRPAPTPCAMTTGLAVSTEALENQRYLVMLNENGDVASIFDKQEKRELLAQPVTLQMLFDKPKQWPAWEIQYEDIMGTPTVLADKNLSIRVVENGPARSGVEVTRKTERSTFRTTIRLSAGGASDRVEFDSEIDWYERQTLLKAAFVLATPSDSATYDLGLGTIRRGLNRPELYEVPGHQWADITSPDRNYGVAILNDCRYGWDHPDPGTIRLTLIHTPGVFDSWAWVGDQRSQDIGQHKMSYAMVGHRGDWRESGVVWQAARFNEPLLAFQTTVHPGSRGKSFSLLTVNAENAGSPSAGPMHLPTVMVNAVKQAEDGNELVIRMRELSGRPIENVRLQFAQPVLSAREVNGAEETVGRAEVINGVLVTNLSAYQPRAFAMQLAPDETGHSAPPACISLPLPYDLDGVSLDGDRGDGNFDGNGHTLAGELFPDTLIDRGILFVFGPSSPEASNVLRCNGQSLPLPEGQFNRLFLLATAVGGPAQGTFSLGKKDTTIWVQDYAEPIGQWNNRLVAGAFVEEPEQIAPAYINTAPVAWFGTHRHGASGENEAYQYTYLYVIRLGVSPGAKALTLPANPRIRVLAATLADTGYDDIRPAQPLYDITNSTLAKISATRKCFVDSLEVHLDTPIPGAEVHYTLDNSIPTRNSPIYAEPIVFTTTGTVKARALLSGADDSHVTSATFQRLGLRDPMPVRNPAPGLMCRYFEGTWRRLPAFDSLSVIKDTVASIISVPGFARPENYGLLFSGYLNVPRHGLYDFYLSSDDGSVLYIDDSLVIDNDGLHGMGEVPGSIALKAGAHRIELRMFQAKGDQGLAISVEGPGIGKETIPADWLFHVPDIGQPRRR